MNAPTSSPRSSPLTRQGALAIARDSALTIGGHSEAFHPPEWVLQAIHTAASVGMRLSCASEPESAPSQVLAVPVRASTVDVEV